MSVGRVTKQPDKLPYHLQGDIFLEVDPVGRWDAKSTTGVSLDPELDGDERVTWNPSHPRARQRFLDMSPNEIEKFFATLVRK